VSTFTPDRTYNQHGFLAYILFEVDLYGSRKSEGMVLHRVFSAILGLVLALAGLVAASYIQVDFKRDMLLSGAVGILVPGVLMLSAFYMAWRFLRFAATGKK
jgi:uncharacterized membrane protein YjjP (DUF1212 family)